MNDNLNELAFPAFNSGGTPMHNGLSKQELGTLIIAAGIAANHYSHLETEEQLKSIADRASKLAEIILSK